MPPSPPISLGATKSDRALLVKYTVEGIRANWLIVQAQLGEVIQDKVERVVFDRRIKMKLPTIEEKRVFYNLGLKDNEDSSVRIDIVLIDQVSPDTLAVAVGLGRTPKDEKL